MCNYLQVGERGHVVEDAVGELRDFIAVEGPEGGGGVGGDKNKQVLVFGCWRSELKTLKHVCSSKQIARILKTMTVKYVSFFVASGRLWQET